MNSSEDPSRCTLVLESGENLDFLAAKLAQAFYAGQPAPSKILVACPPGLKAKTLQKISAVRDKAEVLEFRNLFRELPPHVSTPLLAFLPVNAPYSPPPLENLEKAGRNSPFVRPWIPLVSIPETQWARLVYMAFGWVSNLSFLQWPLDGPGSLDLSGLERASQKNRARLPYLSSPSSTLRTAGLAGTASGGLTSKSKILALVPHFKCEQWLDQCLDSLVRQTRPPDAIAVLDDASPNPPLDIVRQYGQVTLLKSPENVGPYRMLQSVIGRTDFNGYLFQDADDWSSLDRLERLLEEAERTGAEWIGTQELMYFDETIHAMRYPLDLNHAAPSGLRHPFCYPSSLISGNFLTRLGGFASGLHFSGDFELLSRALFAGKVRNLDRYCYYRRIRKDSLITSETTGLASQARKEVDQQVEKRKGENLDRISKGLQPLLEPIKTAAPLRFEHLAGPALIKV